MVVRIGVLGTGAIGQDHILRLTNKISASKVIAVNDLNADNSKTAADKAGGAKIYTDPHELINADEIDAVIVTSWGPSHEEFVTAAIQAGKYVFCEKPLATTAQGCKNIVETELKQGKRLLQVGFMRPFDRTYRTLKNALDNNVVGAR
ncbi:Gfo/Idh/MocA family oxidoreductase [Pasteurellaceae bacterium LIM206]|nr:Gfo/Idh/MocA family oxidoreductase [Pasteurellaceae bacterium LIM206]